MCFAAGILITSPLLFAFPEANKLTEHAGISALLGFLFMYFASIILDKISIRQENKSNNAFILISLLGIGIHSLLDGIIYSVTFKASIAVGLLAGLGLVIHEFSEGVITFSLLVENKLHKKKATIIAFLVAALTTPIGALISYPLISGWSHEFTGLALGFVTGVLIYTSASHLLPEAESGGKEHSYISMVLGVLFAIGTHFFH